MEKQHKPVWLRRVKLESRAKPICIDMKSIVRPPHLPSINRTSLQPATRRASCKPTILSKLVEVRITTDPNRIMFVDEV